MIRPALARVLLAIMLPLACAWIARQERHILASGKPLDSGQLADARALGITEPTRIRVLHVPFVPLPGHWLARKFGFMTGVLSTETVGLSARYGIFLRMPHHQDRRLLAHELTHTRQYERFGGIRPFLRRYLWECMTIGYYEAPLEWEAIKGADFVCG